MNEVFRDFLRDVKPISFREPLADTLGAFATEGAVIEYTFIDAVKAAGHVCPTVAGAYLCCQRAMERLYPGAVPVRGDISITVYGEPDEGVYGVMSQVFTFLTGAAPLTGFRGLGRSFRRKDLLKFTPDKIDQQAMCFEFKRVDSNKAVLLRFNPREIPFPPAKAERLGELMEKVLWDAAKDVEKREFQQLWMDKVHDMVISNNGIERWLQIEERRQ